MEITMKKNIAFTLLTVSFLTLTTSPLFAAATQSGQGDEPILQNQRAVVSSTKETRKMKVRQIRQFLKAQADQEC
jgi:prephenate dehydrogenase